MPSNNINKVVLGNGTTLIDLTNDTVDPTKVLSGYSFHDKTGSAQQGTYVPPGGVKSGTVSPVSNSMSVPDLIGAHAWALVPSTRPSLGATIIVIGYNNGTIMAYTTSGKSWSDISSSISFNSGTGTITYSGSGGYSLASTYFYVGG